MFSFSGCVYQLRKRMYAKRCKRRFRFFAAARSCGSDEPEHEAASPQKKEPCPVHPRRLRRRRNLPCRLAPSTSKKVFFVVEVVSTATAFASHKRAHGGNTARRMVRLRDDLRISPEEALDGARRFFGRRAVAMRGSARGVRAYVCRQLVSSCVPV